MVYILKRCELDYGLASVVCFDPITGTLAAVASAVSAATTVAGTVMSVQGANQQASAAKQSAAYQAQQLEQQAQQTRAASQRQAIEHDRQTQLAQGQLVSRAAASGAGATDETVLGLGSSIAGRGEYEHLMAMFNGESTARGYDDAASAALYNGQIRSQAAKMTIPGTIVSGVGSLASKYSSGGFKLPDASGWFGASPSYTNGQLVGRKSVYG